MKKSSLTLTWSKPHIGFFFSVLFCISILVRGNSSCPIHFSAREANVFSISEHINFSPSRGDAKHVSPRETVAEGCIVSRNPKSKDDSLKRIINRDANRASLMSAVIPGLGQVYNKKYWKVPLIYAALGGIGYFALRWNSEYQDYHNELLYRYEHNQQINSFSEYTTDNLIVLKNQTKKYRDMCFIGMGIVYVLNIIDANVDAHLKKFDVSDNLTLSIRPKAFICVNSRNTFGGGISLALHFK